jgi:hypothetical protein
MRDQLTVIGATGTAAVAVLSIVLAFGAVGKLRAGRQQALAVGELLAASAALLVPAPASGAVLAAAFAAFSIVHLRDRRRSDRAACECFGPAAGAPSPRRAAVLTASSAALAAVIAAFAVPSVPQLISRDPAAVAPVLFAGLLGAALWRAVFTAGPGGPAAAADRLVLSSAAFLERRYSRRSLLIRIAVGGSALAVAPLRYLLYPGSALAAITPRDCSGGLCTDGYTGFCCQINEGLNACPEGTFPGGWWMCTDYTGRRLCAEQGVRYYVDCNALPSEQHTAQNSCHCGNGDCGSRRIGCNVFRYGQCNTQISGVTAVVCRMILCENPSRVPSLNCSSSMAVDNAVCGHDADCLEPAARQLVGAGGV